MFCSWLALSPARSLRLRERGPESYVLAENNSPKLIFRNLLHAHLVIYSKNKFRLTLSSILGGA